MKTGARGRVTGQRDNLVGRLMRPGDGGIVAAAWAGVLPDRDRCADWLPAFIAAPRPYLNARLLRRHRDGDGTVFLKREGQAIGNATDGLTMFVMEYWQETFDFTDPWAHQLLNTIVPIYHRCFRGNNIKRILHETEVAVGHIQVAGGNPHLFDTQPDDPFSMSPGGGGPSAVYGITRDDALSAPATGISKVLLYYTAPELRLSLRQQDVAILALDGMTDAAIAEALGISRDGVRQHWRAIFDRIETFMPGFFSDPGAGSAPDTRGGEKRRQTLRYLDARPQELRPFAYRGRA